MKRILQIIGVGLMGLATYAMWMQTQWEYVGTEDGVIESCRRVSEPPTHLWDCIVRLKDGHKPVVNNMVFEDETFKSQSSRSWAVNLRVEQNKVWENRRRYTFIKLLLLEE